MTAYELKSVPLIVKSVKKKSIEKNIAQLAGQQTMTAIRFVGHVIIN